MADKPDNRLHTRALSPLPASVSAKAPVRNTGPLEQGLPWVIELRVVGTASTLQMQLREEMVIGRADPERGVLPEIDLTEYQGYQQGVSRRHAVISLKEGKVNVKDLNSTNGTKLNGVAMAPNQEYRLRHGDELSVGQLKLQVRFAVVPVRSDDSAKITDTGVGNVDIPLVGKGQSVLVVEDDKDIGAVFRAALEQAGFKVTLVDNGVTAVGMVTQELPAAIVIDLMMAEMNTLDFVRFVRKTSGDRRVPVLVAGGSAGGFQSSRALEAGADECLSNPVSVLELVKAVARSIGS